MAIFTYDGKLLTVGTDGLATDSACCCAGANGYIFVPCESPCDSGDSPSILVKVTGSSGTINWAGETWNLPTDSGVTKEACPSNYVFQQFKTVVGTANTLKYGYEKWIQTGLEMFRGIGYANYPGTPTKWYQVDSTNADFLAVVSFSNTSLRIFKGIDTSVPPFTPTVTSTYYANLGGQISGVARATKSDYEILDAWFGSITISGITYTWSRGSGW